MQRLTDQVAVVTGGAHGIGRGIASVLAAEGARVVIADVDDALAESTVADLRKQGLEALAVTTDVTDRASVDAMAALVSPNTAGSTSWPRTRASTRPHRSGRSTTRCGTA